MALKSYKPRSRELFGGDEVTCTITPNDGEDDGTTIGTSVTIVNTLPVLANVSLSPDPATKMTPRHVRQVTPLMTMARLALTIPTAGQSMAQMYP